DGQALGGDVGRSRGGGIGRVVGRIGSCHRDTAHAHGFGGADVLIGEASAGVAARQVIAGQAIVSKGDRGAGRAVIALVNAGGANAQRAGSDVRRSRGGGIGRVVGCIGAGDRDTVDIDGPGGADV